MKNYNDIVAKVAAKTFGADIEGTPPEEIAEKINSLIEKYTNAQLSTTGDGLKEELKLFRNKNYK